MIKKTMSLMGTSIFLIIFVNERDWWIKMRYEFDFKATFAFWIRLKRDTNEEWIEYNHRRIYLCVCSFSFSFVRLDEIWRRWVIERREKRFICTEQRVDQRPSHILSCRNIFVPNRLDWNFYFFLVFFLIETTKRNETMKIEYLRFLLGNTDCSTASSRCFRVLTSNT